jgi:hypothetical protein
VTSADQNKGVYSGFLWEVGRLYGQGNKYKIKTVFWFDSAMNKIINNSFNTIMIAEPIVNVDDTKRQYVIDNLRNMTFYLQYENGQWTLREP